MICIYRYDKYNIAGRPFHDAYIVKLPGLRSCLCIMPISEWGYEPTSSVLTCNPLHITYYRHKRIIS